jgi:hypothetical protein
LSTSVASCGEMDAGRASPRAPDFFRLRGLGASAGFAFFAAAGVAARFVIRAGSSA